MNPIKNLITKFLGMGGDKLMESTGELLGKIDQMSMGEGEKAELRVKLMDRLIDAQLASQSNVHAEIESKHWLAANWRPLLALQWGMILTYTYWLAPMVGLPVVELNDKLYHLLVLCITGYGSVRTLEKVAGKVVPYFTAKQLRKLAKNGVEVE
jgi:hypothetical protein